MSDLGEAIENDRFANELKNARAQGDMDHFARVLSGRLRQMDKRARAANIRADLAEARLAAAVAELPESLRQGNPCHGIRSLRMAHDSAHRRFYEWGYAARVALAFVDRAAGEGITFLGGDDGEPAMDAADVCARFCELVGIELGDTAYATLLKPIPSDLPRSSLAPEIKEANRGEG